MKIVVIVLTFQEAVILPFFLRHYEKFADKIIAFDSGSTDRTVEILQKHPIVELRHREPTGGEINDLENVRIKNTAWKNEGADWVMLVDADEFLYTRDMRGLLAYFDRFKQNAVQSECWQMIGDKVPDGGLLTDHIRQGVRDQHTIIYYDKTLIFKPETRMVFGVGCHEFKGVNVRLANTRVKLLHYKWLSEEYIQAKADALKLSATNIANGHGYLFGKPANEVWLEYYRDALTKRQPVNLHGS